jgi:hypothetical protein
MTQPTFPLIAISKDDSVNLVPEEKYFSKVATSALINPIVFQDTILFDSDNNKWTYKQTSEEFKNTFLTRILAKTFYNPLLDAKVVWTKADTYQIAELKEKLKICVDKDDDIITQFEEPDVIKSAISNAATFAEILKVLNKYIFAVNEGELAQEQESRIK